MEGRQLSPKDYGDRKTINDQDKIEKLMLPSEFMHIPDFRAIVKFSAYGISEVGIPREFFQAKIEHFIDRNMESDELSKAPSTVGQAQLQ